MSRSGGEGGAAEKLDPSGPIRVRRSFEAGPRESIERADMREVNPSCPIDGIQSVGSDPSWASREGRHECADLDSPSGMVRAESPELS